MIFLVLELAVSTLETDYLSGMDNQSYQSSKSVKLTENRMNKFRRIVHRIRNYERFSLKIRHIIWRLTWIIQGIICLRRIILLNAAIDLRALLGWIKQGERTSFKGELKIVISYWTEFRKLCCIVLIAY